MGAGVRLGLCCHHVNGGHQNPFFETELPKRMRDWYAHDFRTAFQSVVPNFSASDELLLMRFWGTDGYGIGLFRADVGRGGDYSAYWLHLPAGILIEPSEIVDILGRLREIMLSSDPSWLEMKAALKDIVSKDYETRSENGLVDLLNRCCSMNSGSGFAICHYRDSQLVDILGKYLPQPEYCECEGVFLTTKPIPSGSQGKRLDLKKFSELISCRLPYPNEVLEFDFTATLKGGGQTFTQGAAFTVNSDVKLTLLGKRSGFIDIELTEVTANGLKDFQLDPAKVQREIGNVDFICSSDGGEEGFNFRHKILMIVRGEQYELTSDASKRYRISLADVLSGVTIRAEAELHEPKEMRLTTDQFLSVERVEILMKRICRDVVKTPELLTQDALLKGKPVDCSLKPFTDVEKELKDSLQRGHRILSHGVEVCIFLLVSASFIYLQTHIGEQVTLERLFVGLACGGCVLGIVVLVFNRLHRFSQFQRIKDWVNLTTLLLLMILPLSLALLPNLQHYGGPSVEHSREDSARKDSLRLREQDTKDS